MKLLTIGTGKASNIADILAKRGAKVNDVNLFKTFAIVPSLEALRGLKNIEDKNKFYAIFREGRTDIRSAFNRILSFNELFEASLIICDPTDEFSFKTSIELANELLRTTEEPRLCLIIVPRIDTVKDIGVVFQRLKILMREFDFTFLFEKFDGYEEILVKSFNVLSLVGEIDARKRVCGEVVVDTSDFLNSLKNNSLSIIGYYGEILPHKIIRKLFKRRYSEISAERTERLIRMFENALKNLSARVDIHTAKKSLMVFSGDPDEITMDGIFECIRVLERMNSNIAVRYGDYPLPNARHLNVVVVFSGIKKFKL